MKQIVTILALVILTAFFVSMPLSREQHYHGSSILIAPDLLNNQQLYLKSKPYWFSDIQVCDHNGYVIESPFSYSELFNLLRSQPLTNHRPTKHLSLLYQVNIRYVHESNIANVQTIRFYTNGYFDISKINSSIRYYGCTSTSV